MMAREDAWIKFLTGLGRISQASSWPSWIEALLLRERDEPTDYVLWRTRGEARGLSLTGVPKSLHTRRGWARRGDAVAGAHQRE